MKFRENIPLSRFSNYKIGGLARFFFEPKNEKEIAWAVREAKEQKLPIFVLGGGTNLLLGDAGFDGLVLKPALTLIKAGKNSMVAGAGASVADLLEYSVTKSLSGLEWAGGLPGTLGGAIRGNAGCFGGETKDVIVSVRSFNMTTMKAVTRTAKACRFDYRHSIFKNADAKGASNEIILSAELRMKKGDKKEIAKAIKEKIEYRRKNHPLEYPNIGSIFKNIPIIENQFSARGAEQEARIHLEKQEYQAALTNQALSFKGSQFSVKTDPFPVISAAKLISETGLRGVSFGGAMISAKHPNFIVNVLNAGSEDVKTLIALIKSEVKKKFGVQLEEEVQIV